MIKTHPAIRTATDYEVHKVSCPYEEIGFAEVTIPKNGDSTQVDLKQPLKCNFCHRWFRLGVKVVLQGVPVDRPIGAPIMLHPDARAGE